MGKRCAHKGCSKKAIVNFRAKVMNSHTDEVYRKVKGGLCDKHMKRMLDELFKPRKEVMTLTVGET